MVNKFYKKYLLAISVGGCLGEHYSRKKSVNKRQMDMQYLRIWG
jgi:hypothetical protein